MYLNQRTRDTLERIIGKSADDLKKMDLIEEKSFVEEKTGKNLIFLKNGFQNDRTRKSAYYSPPYFYYERY